MSGENKKVSYHRHALAFETIEDFTKRMADPEVKNDLDKQPYEYCEICQCVPTTILGMDEE